MRPDIVGHSEIQFPVDFLVQTGRSGHKVQFSVDELRPDPLRQGINVLNRAHSRVDLICDLRVVDHRHLSVHEHFIDHVPRIRVQRSLQSNHRRSSGMLCHTGHDFLYSAQWNSRFFRQILVAVSKLPLLLLHLFKCHSDFPSFQNAVLMFDLTASDDCFATTHAKKYSSGKRSPSQE